MSAVATGTSDSMRNISQDKVKAVRLRVPPLPEQRRIVTEVESRLSSLDAARASIESAQRRSQSLRAAILARAFRGELVPQDPADEPAEALSRPPPRRACRRIVRTTPPREEHQVTDCCNATRRSGLGCSATRWTIELPCATCSTWRAWVSGAQTAGKRAPPSRCRRRDDRGDGPWAAGRGSCTYPHRPAARAAPSDRRRDALGTGRRAARADPARARAGASFGRPRTTASR